MSEEKIVNNYYQTNIKTSRNEDSVYTMKYASQQMLIDKLQQENQQLKEEISEWKINYSILQNKVIECNEDRIRLNNVLDEIREYIDGVVTIWKTNPSAIATLDLEYLLQQIDKVKE